MTTGSEDPFEIIVLTGMSGAGRTTASKVLEDLDTFVIDNLPPSMIPGFVALASDPDAGITRVAVVADVRTGQFFDTLPGVIADLRETHPHTQVVYLEADDETLVKRFEESRRAHPTAGQGGVIDGIQRERGLLAEVRDLADLVIDTSDLNVHELRDRLVNELGSGHDKELRVDVLSFGFKHGLPNHSDLVFDVRFLPNPHWVPDLRGLTGRDEAVRDYVFGQEATGTFVEQVHALLASTIPGYQAEGKRYLTIAIGCTGGKHRSVALAEELAAWLQGEFALPVRVLHRDLGME
ncbi:MAG: RNase adapter RapZ [Nitriliruptorales bacterium]|nr:RNase adapter RapZ [Nitriliruptorales bacterium]